MMESIMQDATQDLDVRVQDDPGRLPFDDAHFDFVTAVCVYHHVPVAARAALTGEMRRVLRPGGVFAIIEHNPYNPATRLIVSRTPVDADAILLKPAETRALLREAGFSIGYEPYFLYLPEKLYQHAAAFENLLRHVPLGGQYAVFGEICTTC
jgi:SAM-dependent methyltransferase